MSARILRAGNPLRQSKICAASLRKSYGKLFIIFSASSAALFAFSFLEFEFVSLFVFETFVFVRLLESFDCAGFSGSTIFLTFTLGELITALFAELTMSAL